MDSSAIAFQVVTLGLGVTVTALFLLYLTLSLFGCIFNQKKNLSEVNDVAAPKPVTAVKQTTTGPDSKVVAAIVGSLSYLLCDEQAKPPFKISIAPLENGLTGTAWVLAGRKELLSRALKLATLRRRESHA